MEGYPVLVCIAFGNCQTNIEIKRDTFELITHYFYYSTRLLLYLLLIIIKKNNKNTIWISSYLFKFKYITWKIRIYRNILKNEVQKNIVI